MHPIPQHAPPASWRDDARASGVSSPPGPGPAKRARLDDRRPVTSTLELARPALVLPHELDKIAEEARTWAFLSEPDDPRELENHGVSPAARAWALGRHAHEVLSDRLPQGRDAGWIRRLEFAELPDAQDWTWLPAYRQACPNLMEIVLPSGSERVVPALPQHASREADHRWVLRTPDREDGVAAFHQLCDAWGRSLHDLVPNPGELGRYGRASLLRLLAQDVAALEPIEPDLSACLRALVAGIVEDPQIALHCALAAKGPVSVYGRLDAMEEILAELRRMPLPLPQSTLPVCARAHDKAMDMIEGLTWHRSVDLRGCSSAAPGFYPARPRWLDRGEAAAMRVQLAATPETFFTPALRALRDDALHLLKEDPAFENMVFLSREEADTVRAALHLSRLFAVRQVPAAPPWGAAVEAMPPLAGKALQLLRQWVDIDSPGLPLRRERWYLHLARLAHNAVRRVQTPEDLAHGADGEEDPDRPPAALVKTIEHSRTLAAVGSGKGTDAAPIAPIVQQDCPHASPLALRLDDIDPR